MKNKYLFSFAHFKKSVVLTLVGLMSVSSIIAQVNPEVLYYRFDSKSATNKIFNYATNPPTGADSAQINGNLTLGDTGLCGTALVGTGVASNTDYVDTKWQTQITGSWTYAMWMKKIPTSSTLFYIFGDVSAGSFRCFTNGVAGSGNWILRGPFSDLLITGGANMNDNHLVFTYNDTTKELKGYLNGTLNKTVTLTTSPNTTSTGTLKVCGYSSNVGLPSGGLMDNFMVFNHAVSASDVTKLFSGATYTQVKLSGCDQVLSPSKKYLYTKSGVYNDTLVGYSRCDSILQLNVTVNTSSKSKINPVVCSEFTSPSKKYTYQKSGTYYDTLVNSTGCDSIIEINLTVNYPTTYKVSKTVCGSYTSANGNVYTSTGVYTDTLKNVNGCDSFIITDLTVNYSSKSQVTLTVCDVYQSPMGKTYTSSGTYFDTLVNSQGCDSLITTDLTVLQSTTFEQDITACDSFVGPTGTVYTTSGQYHDVIKNAAGCDSMILTNLTINHSFLGKEIVRVCGGYRSPKGNWITQSGMYYDTLTTVNGCDSIYVLDVTIDTVNVGVTVDNNIITATQQGASYQWLDCANGFAQLTNATFSTFAPSIDGTYAVEVTLNTCKDTSECVQLINVSTNNPEVTQIKIHPNPTKGELLITHNQSTIDGISVFNVNGQKLVENNQVQSKSVSIDLSSFPNGVYFIEVNSKGQSSKYKVIKSN